MTWLNGRWQHATQFYSPNYDARPPNEQISLIVLHNISLPPFEYNTRAIEQLFTNQIEPQHHPFLTQLLNVRVSSHFLITREGEINQFVSCDDMAFHAGVSQFHGREKCNTFSIGIELEGCDFEPFTQTQYLALLTLCQVLCQAYPIDAITGHQDIAPDRKTDPGYFFDWSILQKHHLPIDRNDIQTN